MTKGKFATWLETTYLNWQLNNGRASIRAFARWLEINHALVIQWMNDKALPGDKSIPQLVDKLGPEVYDILGLRRPDPVLDELIRAYDAVAPEGKKELLKAAFRLAGFEQDKPDSMSQ